ncbi:MAG: glycoside hydrolase family 127 protein, partial [Marinilabiliales bacterium]|nr:glycoside hydrolase family 127 protein [Marinilabiliales bacterium]
TSFSYVLLRLNRRLQTESTAPARRDRREAPDILRLRRLRRLQDHRGRRPTRWLSSRDPALDGYLDDADREDRRRAGAGRLPLHRADHRPGQAPWRWPGKERWIEPAEDSHELYNLGHLYEAAVAHYQATGKRTLLDVALKSADLVCPHVRPGGPHVDPSRATRRSRSASSSSTA